MHIRELPVEIIELVYTYTTTYSYIALSQTSRSFYTIGHASHLLNQTLSRKVTEEYGDGAAEAFPWCAFREGLKQCSLCPRCALKRTKRITDASRSSSSVLDCHRIHEAAVSEHINDAMTHVPDPGSQLSSRRGSADSAFSSVSSGVFSEVDRWVISRVLRLY